MMIQGWPLNNFSQRFLFFFIILLQILCLPKSSAAVSGFVYADYMLAHVTGLAQTPRGGNIGTSNLAHPSFADVNIQHDNIYGVGIGGRYNDYFAAFDYHHWHPQGSNVLQQNLTTHGRFIPAGNVFNMQVIYDWCRLGFGKNYFFLNDRLTFSPLIIGNWLQYHYEFSSIPASSIRTYTLLAANVGFEVDYQIMPRLSAFFQTNVSIPVSNLNISQAVFGFAYDVLCFSRVTITPNISLGFLRIDYEDNQTFRNHLRYRAWPYVNLGLMASFG